MGVPANRVPGTGSAGGLAPLGPGPQQVLGIGQVRQGPLDYRPKVVGQTTITHPAQGGHHVS